VLLTAITVHQLSARIQNLHDNGIIFDEFYPTKGIKKSDIIKAFAYRATKHDLFVDDMIKNCFDVAENLPGITIFTLNTPYNETFVGATGQLDHRSLKCKIQSFNYVNDIFIASLQHVSGTILQMKGLKTHELEKAVSIIDKNNPQN
jgi:hypothetical protein